MLETPKETDVWSGAVLCCLYCTDRNWNRWKKSICPLCGFLVSFSSIPLAASTGSQPARNRGNVICRFPAPESQNTKRWLGTAKEKVNNPTELSTGQDHMAIRDLFWVLGVRWIHSIVIMIMMRVGNGNSFYWRFSRAGTHPPNPICIVLFLWVHLLQSPSS